MQARLLLKPLLWLLKQTMAIEVVLPINSIVLAITNTYNIYTYEQIIHELKFINDSLDKASYTFPKTEVRIVYVSMKKWFNELIMMICIKNITI